MSAAISRGRAAWIFVRLGARKRLNQFSHVLMRGKKATPGRTATPAKRAGNMIMGAFVGIMMIFSFANIWYQAVTGMERSLGTRAVQVVNDFPNDEAGQAAASGFVHPRARDDAPWTLETDGKIIHVRNTLRERMASAPSLTLAPDVVRGLSLMGLLLSIALTVFELASRNQELSRPEWDLEWLATLPVPLSTILSVRVLERTLLSPFGLVMILPLHGILAYECGWGVASPLVGLLVTVPILYLIALFRTIAETWLRFAFAPARLRNIQAMCTLASLVLLWTSMAAGMGGARTPDAWFARLSRAAPDFLCWTPSGIAVRAIAAREAGGAALSVTLLLAMVAALGVGGMWLLGRQLADGVVSGGMRESGGRLRKAPSGETARFSFLAPIQRKELMLLSRDRNFLVQTLVVPLAIGGSQFIFNPHLLETVRESPQHLATAAFGIAAYTLMFSAMQVLTAEGPALWLLYTVPRGLESIVWQKMKLWGAAALVYATAIFAAGTALGGSLTPAGAADFALVLYGVPVYATIAASLGVFAANPLEIEPQRRIRPDSLYLFMLLAALYSYAIYAGALWPRTGVIVLTTLLAFALWQKARDRLPYLLDPSAAAAPVVSLADGMSAALVFFVAQGVAAMIGVAASGGAADMAQIVTIAFISAGALTYAGVRYLYWRTGTTGVPRVLGDRPARAAAMGVAGGAVAAAIGAGYLQIVRRFDLFAGERSSTLFDHSGAWLIMLLVVAAPVFEEFIFRGLVFGGLRRSVGPGMAIAGSAAIFAICHPPVSAAPVFCLGVAAAIAYERAGSLIAPMLVHAVYNGAVVAMAVLAPLPRG